MDFIVPFAVKVFGFDLTLRQFLVADFPAFLVSAFIDPGMDFQTRFRRRRPNRFDYDLQGLQRHALPVPRDVAEQAVLDLVPLARPRRIMTHLDDQPRLVRPLLEFPLPQPAPRAIAATAVGGDQHSLRRAILLAPQLLPPTPDRPDRKLRGVVADPHRDPRRIPANIVRAIRHRFAQLRIGKIVRLDGLRISLRPLRFARILQVSEHFLLLGVHRNGRFTTPLAGRHAIADVAKLTVPIRMVTAFPRLAIALQTVVQRHEHPPHRGRADGVALRLQLGRQTMGTLDRPPQRVRRRASRRGIDQTLQRLPQVRLGRRPRLATAAPATLTRGRKRIAIVPLEPTVADRAVREARRQGHGGDSTPSQDLGFDGGPAPSSPLVQLIEQVDKLVANRCNCTRVLHSNRMTETKELTQGQFGSLFWRGSLPNARLPRRCFEPKRGACV